MSGGLESDLADCAAMLEAAGRLGESVRREQIVTAIGIALQPTELTEGRRARLEALLEALARRK